MGKLWEKLGSRGSLCYESFRRHGAAAWLRISLKRWCSCCSAASNGRFHLFVPFTIHLRNFRGEVLEKSFFGYANEPFARGYPAERGSGGALGRRRLTNLARRDPAAPPAPCQYDSFLQGKILNRRDSLPLLRFGLAGADLADHGRIEDSKCDLRG